MNDNNNDYDTNQQQQQSSLSSKYNKIRPNICSYIFSTLIFAWPKSRSTTKAPLRGRKILLTEMIDLYDNNKKQLLLEKGPNTIAYV